jgi:hypothetical protein
MSRFLIAKPCNASTLCRCRLPLRAAATAMCGERGAQLRERHWGIDSPKNIDGTWTVFLFREHGGTAAGIAGYTGKYPTIAECRYFAMESRIRDSGTWDQRASEAKLRCLFSFADRERNAAGHTYAKGNRNDPSTPKVVSVWLIYSITPSTGANAQWKRAQLPRWRATLKASASCLTSP